MEKELQIIYSFSIRFLDFIFIIAYLIVYFCFCLFFILYYCIQFVEIKLDEKF